MGGGGLTITTIIRKSSQCMLMPNIVNRAKLRIWLVCGAWSGWGVGWLYTRKSHTSIAHPYRIHDSARRSLSQAMAIVVMGCFCEGVFCCECG